MILNFKWFDVEISISTVRSKVLRERKYRGRIPAIKLHRHLTGANLRDSLTYVDGLI